MMAKRRLLTAYYDDDSCELSSIDWSLEFSAKDGLSRADILGDLLAEIKADEGLQDRWCIGSKLVGLFCFCNCLVPFPLPLIEGAQLQGAQKIPGVVLTDGPVFLFRLGEVSRGLKYTSQVCPRLNILGLGI